MQGRGNLRRLPLNRLIFAWATVTAAYCVAFVVYARTLPPDELVMANSLGFQVLVSLFVVGLPSLLGLFLFPLCYPIVRDLLARRRDG